MQLHTDVKAERGAVQTKAEPDGQAWGQAEDRGGMTGVSWQPADTARPGYNFPVGRERYRQAPRLREICDEASCMFDLVQVPDPRAFSASLTPDMAVL